jgi:hypothetical protein
MERSIRQIIYRTTVVMHHTDIYRLNPGGYFACPPWQKKPLCSYHERASGYRLEGMFLGVAEPKNT